MAGYGRNESILREHFDKIEMLDACKEWINLCPPYVTKHHTTIQKYEWPPK